MKKLIILPAALALVLSGCSIPDEPANSAKASTPKPAKKKKDAFGPGTYQVNKEIRPGTYKTGGPEKDDITGLCYWSRMKDLSGDIDAIIANGSTEGPAVLTIKKTDRGVEFSGSCEWRRAK